MVALRLVTVAVGAACLFALADGAQARGRFDGSWSVSVQGRSGACAGGNYQYNLQIVNGAVRYNGGDAQISGRVSPSGAVFVRVVSAQGDAAGSGHLRGNSGGGSFRGASSQGTCAGTWIGQRTGG